MRKLSLFMLMAVGLLISGNAWADNVAKIVETGDEYATLSAAVSAATSGQTIQLLDNVSSSGTLMTINKNLKLDLGEYFLTNTLDAGNNNEANNNKPAIVINQNCSLTVDATTGGINANNNPAFAVNAGSNLTINGGEYLEDGDNCRYALFHIAGSSSSNLPSITINGGTYRGQRQYRYGTIIHIDQACNLTINGGDFSTISLAETKGSGNQGGLIVATNASSPKNITITDGKFELDYAGASNAGKSPMNETWACIDYRSKKGTISISGGEFINKITKCENASQKSCALYIYDLAEKVNITGGTFKSYGCACRIYASSVNVDKVGLTNTSFISETGVALILMAFSNQEYNIKGGSFSGTQGVLAFGYYDTNTSKITVNITNCTINASSCGVTLQGRGEVNILGGSIESDGIGARFYQGSSLSKNGTINIGGSASIKAGTYGVKNDQGTINITGGRIWGETNSVWNVKYLECAGLQGTVEVTGGVFNNRPVHEGYIIRTETPSSAPRRAALGIIGGGEGPSPVDPPTPPCDKTAQEGNATILGIGLDVIDNPDQATKALGYLYTVGRPESADIIANTEPGATNDWATNTTWTDGETNVIPTVSDNVEIPTGKDVIVGESVHTDAVAYGLLNLGDLTIKTGNSLTIAQILKVQNEAQQGGELGKVTVEAGARLTVGNAQDVDELNIILEDDGENGTGVMLFNPEANVEGVKATIELHSTAHKDDDGNRFWNYIGIPLKTDNFTADNWEKVPVVAGQETGSYLQTWDFTEGWVNNGLEAFKPFQGVAITNDSKDGVIYRFKGTMVGNADKNMVFKPRGYNFFANSYTAPIDIETLLNELKDNGVVDVAIYMFDTENNRFQSVALSAFAGFIPPYFRVIPSMNGFFILNQQTQVSGQTMDYGDAVYNCALGNRPIYAPAHEAMNFSRVHINVEANGSKDGLYLIENDEFTSEFENGYDVIKYMTGGQSNIYAQTTAGRLSQLFNSNIEGTMVGFEAAANQTMYTLSFDELQGETFMLTDMVTGEMVVMNEDNTYTFFAQAGQNNDNRFMVTRVNKAPTAMDNVKGNVKAQGIYSVMGHYFGNVTEWNRLPQGVYMVNGVKVVKY